MSTTTTPSRNGRGMSVPGINTSFADCIPTTPPGLDTSNPDNKSMVFAHLAPLTPPQSAISNESRRPSLAYSSLSEAHSGPSSVCGYSQPPTPISPMHGQDFRHQWSEGTDVHGMQNGLPDVCSHGQMPPPMFNPSFSHQPTQAYSAADTFGNTSTQSPWFSHQQSQQQGSYQSGLRATLFQTSQSLGHESIQTASMYANPSPTIPSLEASPFSSSFDIPPAHSAAIYQPTQVVVPSQVTPHDDYTMEDYPGYASHEEVSDGYNNSFESGTSSCSAWDMVGHTSPVGAYFEQSDEDDFVAVKDEALMSPHRGTVSRSYPQVSSSNRPRTRRGTSHRTRNKAHGEGKEVWLETEKYGISVGYEGKRFVQSFDPTDNSTKYVPVDPRDTKIHKCDHEGCGRSFDRSEHLKRHKGMHSKVKDYVCPKCEARFGRPDNTSDHFKTHLRGPGKGKRNKDCDFPELEAGIIERYDEKTANKLLQNLRKWMVAEKERKAKEERKKMMEEIRKSQMKAQRCN